MKGVQCYELFRGIALKNHTFSFFFHFHLLNGAHCHFLSDSNKASSPSVKCMTHSSAERRLYGVDGQQSDTIAGETEVAVEEELGKLHFDSAHGQRMMVVMASLHLAIDVCHFL